MLKYLMGRMKIMNNDEMCTRKYTDNNIIIIKLSECHISCMRM